MVGSSSENKEEKYRDPGGNWLLAAGCWLLVAGCWLPCSAAWSERIG
jgi:hypothetical protein